MLRTHRFVAPHHWWRLTARAAVCGFRSAANPPKPTPTPEPTGPRFIRWFRELSMNDISLVGGKNASLGEMVQQLAPLGVKVCVLYLPRDRAFSLAVQALLCQ